MGKLNVDWLKVTLLAIHLIALNCLHLHILKHIINGNFLMIALGIVIFLDWGSLTLLNIVILIFKELTETMDDLKLSDKWFHRSLHKGLFHLHNFFSTYQWASLMLIDSK